ncbi:MAG: ATP-binding cassette domain-containing protein, partial [Acidimicrobiales bacterium]
GLRGDVAALRRLDALTVRRAPVSEPEFDGAEPAGGATPHLDDVSAGYDGSTLLVGVTARVLLGHRVVVTGPSGSGKTAIARLLARFVDPVAGALDLGGVAYDELTSATVREHVGLVDDEPHVFATTLAGNLRVADPDATDDELVDALGAAGLGRFYEGLELGLATALGGAGVGLSGGERRRLGVARELLADRPVAVFDEPTEGLDDAAAAELSATLRRRYATRALVIVSHREDELAGASRWHVGNARVEVTP